MIYLWILLSLLMLSVFVVVIKGVFNISSQKKDSAKKSNKLMMLRVAAQAISIIILLIIWFVYKA